MRSVFLCPIVALVFLFFVACENRYRKLGRSNSFQSESSKFKTSSSVDSQKSGLAKDAYQVTKAEFDEFFIYRYGLLYQKFSDEPFSGKIVTIEKGEAGDFVSTKETWKSGRKDGLSTRWFSNGVKMYERNYNEGKWHGTITRWWPNGQKMYVRAYTNGKRHGKEATWRSDGTPIDRFVGGTAEAPANVLRAESDNASSESADSDLPGVFEPSDQSVSSDLPAGLTPMPLEEPSDEALAFPAEAISPTPLPDPVMTESVPVFEPVENSGTSELDSFPGSSTETNSVESVGVSPQLPADQSLPGLPALDDGSSSNLPPMPETPIGSEPTLPPLPETPASSLDDGLPPFPSSDSDGLPSLSESGGGLPPLPADGALPPLPEAGGGLPPLPEDGALPPLPEAGGDLPPLPEDGALPPLPLP